MWLLKGDVSSFSYSSGLVSGEGRLFCLAIVREIADMCVFSLVVKFCQLDSSVISVPCILEPQYSALIVCRVTAWMILHFASSSRSVACGFWSDCCVGICLLPEILVQLSGMSRLGCGMISKSSQSCSTRAHNLAA